ncbi:hypothetical protein [Streptomyces sp. Ac-502]|uniref:hypothetical protein n=1 Tax=Streptomyces sp. Ac-502 TaxID=3342801 RepID=UPI003862276B
MTRRAGVALFATAALVALPVLGTEREAAAVAAAAPVAGVSGTVAGPGEGSTGRFAEARDGDHGGGQRWRGAWATSAQAPHALSPNWSTQGFTDQTVRQVVRVSTGVTRPVSSCPTVTAGRR